MSGISDLSDQSLSTVSSFVYSDLNPRSSVTHLVHITGPLHDVLEGSLTRDIIHQEDSLEREREREMVKHFKSR